MSEREVKRVMKGLAGFVEDIQKIEEETGFKILRKAEIRVQGDP